ncbi:mitochondrial substrate carrier [Scenedesmus sp. NREL 46B-D3]|nr:mitochondrial substrate carrier [Scenedesmus sp. NREL 46B-D3]
MHVPAQDDSEDGKQPKLQRVALDATAGALAGAISRFMVGPLDVVKIRFQVQLEPISMQHSAKLPSHYTGFLNAFKTIVADEGIRGLWNGTVPGLLLTIPYTAVQFVALQQCKEAAAKLGWGERSSTPVAFTSGALAGAAATVASYPFDLLRTTLAAQGEPKVYRGMTSAARAIYREHGLPGLYRGLGVTLVEIMPYAALQFGLYDAFNKASAEQLLGRKLEDRKLQSFLCGLSAGLIAKLGSHPLDVAKKRYQVAGLPRSLRYGARVESRLAVMPLLACLGEIKAKEGLAGLWKGSVPSIVKAAPAAAITFTAYEALIGFMLAWSQRAVQPAAPPAEEQAWRPTGSKAQ